MIRGPIDGKYVELWGIPAWRRKLGIGDESLTLTQRIELIVAGIPGTPDSGPGSVENANARLAAFATLEEAGYIVQTSTFPPAFAGRKIYSFTDNQIHVTNGTGINGDTLLQLPQDIHDGATPEFLTIKPTLLNIDFVTYVDAVGALASTTTTATELSTAVASAAAMDILTTRGDLLSHNGTTYIRVPVGAANTVTRTDGLDVLWGKVVLTTDVTGVLPVANGGTNASSWTPGSVIFAGAGGTSLAQDNANLFWDDATNALGVGLALPLSRLHLSIDDAVTTVTDVLRINHSLNTGGTAANFGTGILLTGETSTTDAQDMARIQTIWTTSTHATRTSALQFQTVNSAAALSTRMWITPVGVGIGTGATAPGALLDLGLAGTTLGVMRLAGSTSGNVTIQPQAIAGTWTLQLPQNDGGAGEFLQTDGAGITSWAAGASVTPSALTRVDDTNITLTLGGSPTVALLAATSLTLGWTGVLSVARGGTNNGAWSGNSIPVLDATATQFVEYPFFLYNNVADMLQNGSSVVAWRALELFSLPDDAAATIGLGFWFTGNDATNTRSQILFGKEQLWTSTASTRDSYISLETVLDNVTGQALGLRSSGSVICGKDATATNRTDDFTYICTTNGVPTGVPTTFGSRVPITFDPNTDTLYVYRGGWKGVVLT